MLLSRIAFSPIHLLLAALAASLSRVGFGAEAAVTIVVVVVNVVVHGVQLALAESRLAALRRAFQSPVSVWRADALVSLAPDAIVVGDIAQLTVGDRLPAECRLLESAGLTLDIAPVTGESERCTPAPGDSLPAGAIVVGGAAWVEVTALAPFDAGSARQRNETANGRRARWIVGWSAVAAAVVALITVAVGSARGIDDVQLLRQLTVVAGLIPNALVLFVTVTHLVAAVADSRAGVLVQDIAAAAEWAAVDVVCFDKTGTLTANDIHVARLVPMGSTHTAFADLVGAYAACDGAGNRNSHAIAVAYPRTPLPVVASHGFTSTRKWSALQTTDASYYLGAPEILAAALLPEWRAALAAETRATHDRVLLLVQSARPLEPDHTLPDDGVPVGLVVLHDTLRPGAAALVEGLQAAGVRCVVISGDDPATAAAVAAAVGVSVTQVCSGTTLPAPTAPEYAPLVRNATVIGRVVPEQKADIVAAWQQTGARVAFVGDGINDIPALRQAAVGIAFAAAQAAVRESAGLVVTTPDAAVLARLRRSGADTTARIERIARLVVTRVVAATLLWVGTILLSLPTWTPFDSTAIALFGVGLPSLLLAIFPHSTHALPTWPRVIGRAVVVGVLLCGVWWGAVGYGVTAPAWLTGAFIAVLWCSSGVRLWAAAPRAVVH